MFFFLATILVTMLICLSIILETRPFYFRCISKDLDLCYLCNFVTFETFGTSGTDMYVYSFILPRFSFLLFWIDKSNRKYFELCTFLIALR